MRSPRVSRRAFTLTVKTRLFLPWVPRDDLRSNFKLTPNKKLFYILKNTKYVSLLWNEFVSLVFKRSMPPTSPSPTTPSPWWICGDLRIFFFFPFSFLVSSHSSCDDTQDFFITPESFYLFPGFVFISFCGLGVFFFSEGERNKTKTIEQHRHERTNVHFGVCVLNAFVWFSQVSAWLI